MIKGTGTVIGSLAGSISAKLEADGQISLSEALGTYGDRPVEVVLQVSCHPVTRKRVRLDEDLAQAISTRVAENPANAETLEFYAV
jgi:hypothetical protein